MKRIGLSVLGLVAVGCGGGGSNSGSVSPFVVSSIAASDISWSPFLYGVQGQNLFGYEVQPNGTGIAYACAYWPSPGSVVVIPALDSSLPFQTTTCLSDDGNSVGGFVAERASVTTVSKGFVYDLKTKKAQFLTFPFSVALINLISISGNTVSGQLSTDSRTWQVFTYNLLKSSYALSSVPNYGAMVTLPSGWTLSGSPLVSSSGQYAIGACSGPGGQRMAEFDLVHHSSQFLSGVNEMTYTFGVSNDGRVAVYGTENPGDTAIRVWLYRTDFGSIDMLKTLNASGSAAGWAAIQDVWLSSDGKDVSIAGDSVDNVPAILYLSLRAR